jgi:hypothetical protein
MHIPLHNTPVFGDGQKGNFERASKVLALESGSVTVVVYHERLQYSRRGK